MDMTFLVLFSKRDRVTQSVWQLFMPKDHRYKLCMWESYRIIETCLVISNTSHSAVNPGKFNISLQPETGKQMTSLRQYLVSFTLTKFFHKNNFVSLAVPRVCHLTSFVASILTVRKALWFCVCFCSVES